MSFAARCRQQQVPLIWQSSVHLGVQAEARQQKWETSAAGRAALKSVKAVQEERAQGRGASNDPVKHSDWLS